MKEKSKDFARKIPTLPAIVTYDDFKDEIGKDDKILKYKKTFESNNYSKDSLIKETKTTIMIIGISDLMNKISVENKFKFGDLFNFTKNMGVIDYIIVDSINQIKKIEFESWFKESVNTDNGIWVGNGINDQFTLKVTGRTDEMRENITDDFCFVVDRGIPVLVKYIKSF